MFSADLLAMHDRCPRSSHWGKDWELNRIHPNEALRRAIDDGLLSELDDPGQYAGDTVMTLAADRGLDISTSPYDCAMHNAALSDIIVTCIRARTPSWPRPEDRGYSGVTWVSGAFLNQSGTHLNRVLVVDRWSEERKQAELHSWRTLGEMAAYELPMTLTVVLVGQRRDGKHHSPWSKGYLHPNTRILRLKKRSGESFSGKWVQCWREEQDNISRDKWIDQMIEDDVLDTCLFEVPVNLPDPAFLSKIGRLIESKMEAIHMTDELPPPNISLCDFPTPCQFNYLCWKAIGEVPSERNGYIKLPNASIPSTNE